ncbi:M15 family metallopeptidase [Glaciihabitans sp. dw_435]|uniref:M15 family metallopeptidase n=1 Tax=Glaciihabitans sp. dw_435 TaxID=2720081 RepID=UPI001BD26FFD|nr:M15 family metallopeptidase [Glaciihabitans sp. dw_435]
MSRRHPHSRAAVTALVLTAAIGLGLAACAARSGSLQTLGEQLAPASSSGGNSARSPEDGYIPDDASVSPFDDTLPAIAKLKPKLRAAIQAAATDAQAEGVEMVVDSGWRSRRLQQALLDAATIEYGSLEEARKWVNTPELSTHVTGNAVDIGYTDADSWLSQHGARYGLCQIYSNEIWHFELATTPGGECPIQRTDAAG